MPSPSADPKFVLSILKFLSMLNFLKYTQNNFGILKSEILLIMPSPSAESKFVLSIPKIFKHTQFFNHTQNIFGILKSRILLHKLDYLSILKTF
jgi:hypothetical protein